MKGILLSRSDEGHILKAKAILVPPSGQPHIPETSTLFLLWQKGDKN
jgi:hypothetical protein